MWRVMSDATARGFADLLMLAVLAYVALGAAVEANVPFVFPALGLLAVIVGWVIMEMRVVRARMDSQADRLARLEERSSNFVTEAALALQLQESRHGIYDRMAEVSAKIETQMQDLGERARELERLIDRKGGA